MNIQEYVDNKLKTDRRERLNRSDQLTLGELIAKLEGITPKRDDDVPDVVFDFCNFFPVTFSSWRGYYYELAIEPSMTPWNSENVPMSLNDFLKRCKETIGKEFTGYKGGGFTMDKTTPIWVAEYGRSGNTALIDVMYDGYSVILVTGYREF